MMKTLEHVRTEIDRVDQEIIKLLKERLELSLEVKAIKKIDQKVVFDPGRENQIMDKLKQGLEQEHHEYLTDLYQVIFEYSRSLQK